jgi:DNA-binding PadR family transcriptional regulator
MAKRKVANPLALAVLTLLAERPMHPYEMAGTMRERGKEHSVRLNYGSLYTVVDALVRAGFISPQETVREGRRPERTVYEITAAGHAELHDWLWELITQPAKEYPGFMAGLTFIGIFPPAKALAALKEREQRLAKLVDAQRADLTRWHEGSPDHPGVPRIFLVEAEYELAMREAELRWTSGLIREVEDGTIDGLELWESFHRRPAQPAGEEAATRRP